MEYCDAAEGCATAGDTLDAVEEVLALAEEPGRHPRPRRRPRRRSRRGQPRHQLRRSTRRACWNDLADALADALDGDGTALVELADDYLDIGDFEVYFAVNCLDFAWPTGDPDAFFAAGQGHGGGVAALR